MAVHSIYAQISEGIVQNIMVCDNYELANELTRASYGDDGFAVECNQCPCVIGDKYHDGGFYRDIEGEGIEIPIEYVPTPEQQVEALIGLCYTVFKGKNSRQLPQIVDGCPKGLL